MSQTFGEAEGVRVVGTKVLEFALEGSIVLLLSSPIDRISMNIVRHKELLNTWPIRASSNGWVCAGMERPRVNGASTPLGRQELWKGTVEIVRDEWGDSVLLAIGDNKKVSGSRSIPVVAPARSWKDTRLRAFWSGHGMFLIPRCVHSCNVKLMATFIEDKSHIFNQAFILDPGFEWVVSCLNASL